MTMGKLPFSELLRPQQLRDLTIPQRDIDRLQRMVDSGNIMNMLFYGEPGTGKTSAVRIIIGPSVLNGLELNGASATGIDYVREVIENFAAHMKLYPGHKICFIDEADGLSPNAQQALQYLIEKTSSNCRYLFTANNVRKLRDGIQSRMMMVCFDVAPCDVDEVLARLQARYEALLLERGIAYDPKRLREIIGIWFPDLRSIANRVEYEFAL